LYIAAIGAVIIGSAHSYLGERTVFPRLLRCADLPRLRGSIEFTQSILRWAWHLTSLAWLGFAYLLFLLALGRTPGAVELSRTISVIFGLTGIVAFATTRGRHIAWPLFAVVAIASWFGVG
ncbi:MAG TPA: hypothetical protein VF215_11755, partial [Thermoanaerobaculia bacterium]